MSTVVALGHFCEVHGPRLVFYTIRNINEPQFVSECPDLKFCSGCKAPLLDGYLSTVQTVHRNSTVLAPLTPLVGGGATGGKSGSRSGGSKSAPHIANGNSSDSSSGTSVVPGSKGLKISTSSQTLTRGINEPIPTQLTNGRGKQDSERPGTSSAAAAASASQQPSEGTRYYCSHSNYDHSHLAHLNTCIARTLSCEVAPSNSVAFTSTDIWVIGTSFSLRDSLARGFYRKYCLIFTFLPEVPQCCQPDSPPAPKEKDVKQSKTGGTGTGATGGSGTGGGTQHLKSCPKHKGDTKQGPPPNRSHAQSLRDEYYSDGDHKGYYNNYGLTGYPSLVPHYDYITEEFFNVAKILQSECDKVFFKEEAISPHKLRLSAILDLRGDGGSSSLRAGPRGFTRTHSTGARSLPHLTDNPHIFLDLHEKFARILHHVDL